jgi:glycosyltransferase involved in cell wall biosynthesis
MKVVHFLTSIDKTSGGVTAYLELLSRDLKNKVDLCIASGISSSPINIEGVPIKFFNLAFKNIRNLTKSFKLYLILEKPQIVHINGIWEPQTWLFQKVAQELNIKVVLSPHGMLEPYILNRNPWKKKIAMLLYQNKAIKKADYIHATANSEIDNIQKLGYTNPYRVIANGIDTTEVVLKTNYDTKKVNLLFLSRLHPKKGLEILLEAILKLKNKNIVLTIAGTGEDSYSKSLIELVKTYDIENRVKFVGGVYGKDKWKLYNSSDCFVLPTHSENFGIVIAEALATGLPVITTKGTPWAELLTHQCGWWINLSVDNIVDTLNQLVSLNYKELQAMGDNGKKLVREKYDIKLVTNSMFQFYKEIIEE